MRRSCVVSLWPVVDRSATPHSPPVDRSRNCCIELAAAILSRGVNQRTWVFVSEDAAADAAGTVAVAEELQAAGMRIYWSGETLLRDAALLAYRVSGPDVARCVQWFRESSDAVPHLARNIRLPAPGRSRRGNPLGPCFSPCPHSRGRGPFRCCPPKRAVFAGSRFLSPDGLVFGSYPAITFQQVVLLVVPILYVADVIFMVENVKTASDVLFAQCSFLDFIFFGSIVVFICVVVPVMLLLPLRVFGDIDARERHSDLLLPLHVAAFMAEAAAVPPRGASPQLHGPTTLLGSAESLKSLIIGRGSLRQLTAGAASFKLCVLMSAPGEDTRPVQERAPVDPLLPERLRNVCAFLRDVGLESVVVPPRREDGTCDDDHEAVRGNAPSVIVVCAYVLRSRAAALAWCAAQHAASTGHPVAAAARAIPFSRQLLVVDGPANDAHVYAPPLDAALVHGQPHIAPAPPLWFRDTVYSEDLGGAGTSNRPLHAYVSPVPCPPFSRRGAACLRSRARGLCELGLAPRGCRRYGCSCPLAPLCADLQGGGAVGGHAPRRMS